MLVTYLNLVDQSDGLQAYSLVNTKRQRNEFKHLIILWATCRALLKASAAAPVFNNILLSRWFYI